MKPTLYIAATLATTLVTGCLNVACHVRGRVPCVYPGTVLATEIIGSFDPQVFVPFAAELPLEVVADTVTLPVDVFIQEKDRSK